LTALVFCALMAAGSQDFDAFFEDFAAKRNGIRTLEARFEQQSVVPEETLVSKGSLLYVKPRRMLFRYEAPDPTYLIDGTKAYQYEADLQQVQSYDLEDNPQTSVFFLGFDDDTSRLREGYQIELFTPDDGVESAKGIRLHPKTKESEEAYFQTIELCLRAEDLLPYRIHIVNDEESQVTIRVSDFVVNQPLEANADRIFLPAGTSIIEDDRLDRTAGEEGAYVPEKTLVGGAPSTPAEETKP